MSSTKSEGELALLEWIRTHPDEIKPQHEGIEAKGSEYKRIGDLETEMELLKSLNQSLVNKDIDLQGQVDELRKKLNEVIEIINKPK